MYFGYSKKYGVRFKSSVSTIALIFAGNVFFGAFPTLSYAQQGNYDIEWISGDQVDSVNYTFGAPENVRPASATAALGYQGDAGAENLTSAQLDDIYIDVIVNGEARPDVIVVRQLDDGSIIINADVLRGIGILPQRAATDRNGWVRLSALKNVEYSVDVVSETLSIVTTDPEALAPYALSLNPLAASARNGGDYGEFKTQSDLAAILNYEIYADSGSEHFKDLWEFQGISTTLDGRISGKFGTFFTSELLRYSLQGSASNKFDDVRLDSYWTYSDQKRMVTYQAGDLITRSLAWSRSTRLGGLQLRRNFDLRDNLITMALPEISGSAAVPSAVDLYINNAQRAVEKVPTGPFSLTDIPVVTGPNTARLVVRDVMGQETTKEISFYASSDLLAAGLWDFSTEAGVPRKNYGLKSADYSNDFFVSGTTRYGFTNALTGEAHLEAGGDFFNGGIGSVFTIFDVGRLAVAGSTSTYKGDTGQQLYASLQLQRWGVSLNASTQRTFGYYSDIASVVDRKRLDETAGGTASLRAANRNTTRMSKSTNQYSLSSNLRFDPTTLTLSYTEVNPWEGSGSRYLSLSANRSFPHRISAFASGFMNLKDSKAYSIFAGLSVALDKGYSVSSNITTDQNGSRVTSQLSKTMGAKIGDYGWSVRDTDGSQTQRSVNGQYRSSVALLSASLDQYRETWRATASASGALVFADGVVVPTQRVSDSFAMVNVGIPDVGIKVNNQEFGKTWRNGRLAIPDLISYTKSNIAINMDTLPADAIVEVTDVDVRPASQSGVVVNFGGVAGDNYLYLGLKNSRGEAVEVGSYAQIAGSDVGFDVGYDGLIIIPLNQVKLPITLHVLEKNGDTCQATVDSSVATGMQTGGKTIQCTLMGGLSQR